MDEIDHDRELELEFFPKVAVKVIMKLIMKDYSYLAQTDEIYTYVYSYMHACVLHYSTEFYFLSVQLS